MTRTTTIICLSHNHNMITYQSYYVYGKCSIYVEHKTIIIFDNVTMQPYYFLGVIVLYGFAEIWVQ